MTPSMDDSRRDTSARGCMRGSPYSSGTQQVPHLASYIDLASGGRQQQGPPYVHPSSRLYTTFSGDQTRGTPIVAQENVYRRQFLGPSFYTTSHTSRGNHLNHVSLPAPRPAPFHRVPQQLLSRSPYLRGSSMMSDPIAYDVQRRDMGESYERAGQHDSQAVQGFLDDPTMDFTHPFRFEQSLPHHGSGVIGASPFPQQRARNWPCPAPGCLSSFDRPQERKHHFLTHLPHWVHCPFPGCCWRGNRLSAFKRHWGNSHPPSGQDLDEGQFKAYDPGPLVERIEEGSLSVEEAKNHAMTMVKEKASELGKQELWENPWGRQGRRAQQLG